MVTRTSGWPGPRRSGVSMVLLLAASFSLTLWLANSNRAPIGPLAISDENAYHKLALAQPIADVPVTEASTAPALDDPDAVQAPVSSLQDQAADQDAGTRDEARILLGLLSEESAED